jgi:hypothetical protein
MQSPVARGTDGSGYTGITSAFIGNKRYLYAANFLKGRIDVYDNAFMPVKLRSSDYDRFSDDDNDDDLPFTDRHLPVTSSPSTYRPLETTSSLLTLCILPATPLKLPAPDLASLTSIPREANCSAVSSMAIGSTRLGE